MTDDVDAQARELLEMMRTPKRRVRPRLAEPLRDAEDIRVDTPVGPVTAWRVGDGPGRAAGARVGGRQRAVGAVLEQLWAVGRSAVVLDLPGHGFSEAEMAGPEGAADALLAVAEQVGPVDAVVGHSFGCPVSILAMKRGLPARRAAMLAAAIPARRGWFDRLADRGVPEAVLTRMGELMGPIYDVEADAPAMTAEALFLHSLDDDATPVENAETLAALWPGARLSLTDGLGHRLIAQDAAVLQQVVEFVG
jgi:pimeloyl-ACP methyl ester carboxylesterase